MQKHMTEQLQEERAESALPMSRQARQLTEQSRLASQVAMQELQEHEAHHQVVHLRGKAAFHWK
jgi:hypothetical protein